MKINITLNTDYNKKTYTENKSENHSSTTTQQESTDKITRNSDSVAFSGNAYKYIKGNSGISVTSGSDILETITNAEQNKISIYFGDSAVLNRTVKRGYIEIDGTRMALSDELKEKLIQADKSAQKARESAFANYNLKHRMTVSKQMSEDFENKTAKDIQAFSISAKMSKGSLVSPKEESLLLKSDPQMYFMAAIAQHMAKEHKKEYDDRDKAYKFQNASNNPIEFTAYKVRIDADMSEKSIIGNSVEVEPVKIQL